MPLLSFIVSSWSKCCGWSHTPSRAAFLWETLHSFLLCCTVLLACYLSNRALSGLGVVWLEHVRLFWVGFSRAWASSPISSPMQTSTKDGVFHRMAWDFGWYLSSLHTLGLHFGVALCMILDKCGNKDIQTRTEGVRPASFAATASHAKPEWAHPSWRSATSARRSPTQASEAKIK